MKKYTGRILALDVATTTGWAFGRPDGPPTFGSIRFGKPGTSRAVCYREFRAWLDMWANYRKCPDLIVFESPVASMMHGQTNVDVIKKLIGMCEHLEEWAHDKIELREANVQQIRQHFIGCSPKREEAKRLTIERCHELKWAAINDNEGDALALLDYQICCLRPDIGTQRTPLFLAKRPATV
jgi:hypothetical protein